MSNLTDQQRDALERMQAVWTPAQREQIERLSNDPILDLFIDGLVGKYEQLWRDTSPEQASDREHHYQMVRALTELRDVIRATGSEREFEAFNEKGV